MFHMKKGGEANSRKIGHRTYGIGFLAGVFLFVCLPAAFTSDDKDEKEEDNITKENVIALHDRNSPQFNKECTLCHTAILTQQSLDPSIPAAHVVMHQVVPGEKDDDKCAFCHQTVNIVQTLAGNLRRHVDVELCTFCHGPSGPANQFFQVETARDLMDGPRLYELTCASCHRELARSEVSGESAEEIQEKIDEDEGGMGPLSNFLSTAQIQAIADALAQVKGDDKKDDD